MSELLQQQIVKWVTGAVFALLGTGTCVSATGCALLPTNMGEIGVRTSWALYHEARKPEVGEDVTASLAVKAPAIAEWFTGTDKPPVVEK